MHAFIHWLDSSWNQIWPNLVAGLFPSGAVVVSHAKRVKLAKRHHEDLKAHVAGVAASAVTTKEALDHQPGEMLQ